MAACCVARYVFARRDVFLVWMHACGVIARDPAVWLSHAAALCCSRSCSSHVQEKAVTKSKYEEDVKEGNHTSVWGSWYDRSTNNWGFACCHQCIRNSYCTGEAGKAARAASLLDGAQRAMSAPAPLSVRGSDQKPLTSAAADLYGEVLDLELDPKKLKAAKERVGGLRRRSQLALNGRAVLCPDSLWGDLVVASSRPAAPAAAVQQADHGMTCCMRWLYRAAQFSHLLSLRVGFAGTASSSCRIRRR
jgi:hypothetical protein